VLVVLAAAGATAVYVFSGATLAADDSALARIDLQTFAGSVETVRAAGPGGHAIPLSVDHGRLTPRRTLAPGEHIDVTVVVRRPSWSSWALGKTRRETLTVVAPVANIRRRWLTVRAGSPVRVRFDTTVSRVAAAGRLVTAKSDVVALPEKAQAGSVAVAAAARSWERLGPPVRVTWFPQTKGPAVLAQPRPGAQLNPLTPLRLTFSKPTAAVLGHELPTLSPKVRGHWSQVDSHTIVFHSAGLGAPFATNVAVHLPPKVTVAASKSNGLRWPVAPASFLRLQQLLAEQNYLPLAWTPDDADVPSTALAQLAAAVSPPAGRFHWRFENTPAELKSLWTEGEPDEVTRGAVMMFQDEHHLAVDGIVGPQVWKALLTDTISQHRRSAGYSYVYVHRDVPQLLTLWHNGHTVLTSPGNTGVPAAPTQLGTWPVFEHIPVGTMSGRNPDGSHYNDPGIRWISYFHGGEALHAFNRASFGTPQSLGCVELPLASAAKVWPYTPIGTLVTIEN
jgi:hypothetical protein